MTNDELLRIGSIPIPDISNLCVHVEGGTTGLKMSFPGGAQLQMLTGMIPGVAPNFGDVASMAMGAANAALAPMTPIFNVIDVVMAVVDCINAVPDAIQSLSPKPLIDCAKKLAPLAEKLLQLVPIMAIPQMIADMIDILIAFLVAIRDEFEVLFNKSLELGAAYAKATKTGNVYLAGIVDCASENLNVSLMSLNSKMDPVNRMLGILNALLKNFGVETQIPECVALSLDLSGSLKQLEFLLLPLDTIIYMLMKIRDFYKNLPGFDLEPDNFCEGGVGTFSVQGVADDLFGAPSESKKLAQIRFDVDQEWYKNRQDFDARMAAMRQSLREQTGLAF